MFVARRGDGWAVEINSATLPRLLVNRAYYAEVSGGRQDKAGKAWLSDCLASANWLIKALDQRQRTIIKVASEIVKQQEAFFLHGVAHLRPMTLRQVAEVIEMHESTVSRVTSNKYLSCSRGVFELKYFFTSAIQSSDGGDAVSANAVKDAIRTLIQAEDAKAILSDDTLVELLNAKGFDIARRTVAKYREALGIGSSVQRRRQKALEGVGRSGSTVTAGSQDARLRLFSPSPRPKCRGPLRRNGRTRGSRASLSRLGWTPALRPGVTETWAIRITRRAAL
ncbi:MAG: hypothetical protein WDN24_22200 [Sphingomonas sp.]